jgi:flagellar basal-body rod modification protein FlgD
MSIETTKLASSTSTTQQPDNAQGSDTLGKNEFLRILTAQLANQDPTKPLDSNAFVAQLAQFSALEQQQNTNDTLTQMLALQQSASGTSAVAMVGKDALYDAHQMDLASDGQITVNATLSSDATDTIMEVDDADGNVIRRQHFGAKSAGSNSLTWDGMNDSGALQAPGSYYISVSAVDISGNPVSVTQQGRARITGVVFEDGSPQLLIGNTSIPLTDVQAIQESSSK